MCRETITRRELYDLVWREPMRTLAPKYGISDVGLAKTCRKNDIPCPPRGYWAKMRHGHDVKKKPLLNEAETGASVVLKVDLKSIARATAMKHHAKTLCDGIEIKVMESFRGCHKLVSAANQELKSAKVDRHKIIVLPKEATLHVTVSKSNLRRALLIIDALLKTLEQLEHTIAAGPTVTIGGAAVGFSISEQVTTKREPRHNHDLSGRYEFGHSQYDEKRVPSGRLTLSIDDCAYWRSGMCRTWRDTDKQRLESRLPRFITGLVAMAAVVRQRDDENRKRAEQTRQAKCRREEENRRRAEHRKRYKAEKKRVDGLMSQASGWTEAEQLRAFIESVRQSPEALASVAPEADLDAWLEWAHRQADRLDPRCPNPPSVLDELPQDDLPEPFSHRGW